MRSIKFGFSQQIIMAIEIERKFWIKNKNWKVIANAPEGTVIKQGYLNTDKERTVRVRIYGAKAFLTIKGKSVGMTRAEFEYEVPVEDAIELLQLCHQPIIEKKRYKIAQDNVIWEIDEFEGINEGLILAEVELESETQAVHIPNWVGEEVTGDIRFYNSNLVNNPFTKWTMDKK